MLFHPALRGSWAFRGRGSSTRSAETPAHLPRHFHRAVPPIPGKEQDGESLPSFKLGPSPPLRAQARPARPRRGPGSRRWPSLQTCERSHPSEWSFSLQSRLRSAAGRLLSGCQGRPEQRHMQQSFTRRASVWGERDGRGTERRTHTLGRTRGETSSSSHPNADFFFSFPPFFPFLFGRTKTLGWVGAVVFPGLLSVDGGRLQGGVGALNARKSRISPAELLRLSVRNLEEEKRGGGRGGGGNN